MTSLLLNKTPASYLMILEDNIIVLKVFREVSKSHSKYWEIVTKKCVFWSLEADEQLPGCHVLLLWDLSRIHISGWCDSGCCGLCQSLLYILEPDSGMPHGDAFPSHPRASSLPLYHILHEFALFVIREMQKTRSLRFKLLFWQLVRQFICIKQFFYLPWH